MKSWQTEFHSSNFGWLVEFAYLAYLNYLDTLNAMFSIEFGETARNIFLSWED